MQPQNEELRAKTQRNGTNGGQYMCNQEIFVMMVRLIETPRILAVCAVYDKTIAEGYPTA